MAAWTTLPNLYHEQVACSIMASIKYQVPANIVLAIAEKESGKPGEWVKNSNGTYDVGSMQFNTAYLNDLKKYGIKAQDVAVKGCYSYDLAAWRLRGHILHGKADLWTKAANYHSKTPYYNQIYRADLIRKAQKWEKWLNAHFNTYPVTSNGVAPIHIKQVQHVLAQDVTETPLKIAPNKVVQAPKNYYPNTLAERALASMYHARPWSSPL